MTQVPYPGVGSTRLSCGQLPAERNPRMNKSLNELRLQRLLLLARQKTEHWNSTAHKKQEHKSFFHTFFKAFGH